MVRLSGGGGMVCRHAHSLFTLWFELSEWFLPITYNSSWTAETWLTSESTPVVLRPE